MSITAMKQALKALEWEDCNDDNGLELAQRKAITSLHKAIEQAEQAQPVGWMQDNPTGVYVTVRPDPLHTIPLYTATQPRQPLTDSEISKLWDENTCPLFGRQGINPTEFARAIEVAHGIKEKNT